MKRLDFSILPTSNSKTLVFVDESKYTDSPVFPTLQVKFPDIERTYKVLISPEKLNVLYTTTLGFSTCNTDFPDGVYEMKYSYEPHNTNYVCKKYMKVDVAYNDLKSIISEITNKDDKYFSKLNEINLLLLSAQLEVEFDTNQAIEYLKLANKLIGKLKCK